MASLVLEEKIFKGFYHTWAWQPSWSMSRDHFSDLLFPHPKEAPYEILAKLAQRLQRRSRLKKLTNGRMQGRTDGRKVITIAHPEHSSGELIKKNCCKKMFCKALTRFILILFLFIKGGNSEEFKKKTRGP